MNVMYIIGILVGAAVIVTGTIIVTQAVRHFLTVKEMKKGPNKILLQAEDLLFIEPKAASCKSVKSNPMFDKPERLLTSRNSLSRNSVAFEVNTTRIARYNGELVFVKALKMKDFEMKHVLRQFIKQLRDVRHENVAAFIGCRPDPMKPTLVFEYCSRHSLQDVIRTDDIKLDWDFKLSLMTDLIKGMKYIHSSLLRFHGSLRSVNCVIDSRWVLKVTDYGVNQFYQKGKAKRPLSDKDLLWTAPEHLREDKEIPGGSCKGDVYSFAIIMQELILRGDPYCMLNIDTKDIIRKVRRPPPMCRPSVSPQAAPPQYVQIMKRCWSELPHMRPDYEQLNMEFNELNKGKKTNIVDTMFKMLEKYSNNLEEIVRERTIALEEEKKKTENLLTQMLPQSVAQSLLMGQPVEPESFDDVTIYFSDIVGFTSISAMSTPIQVVNLLNDLYTMFDATIDDYDVYKVETIGDAYMVSSGLPKRNGHRHAAEISTMALDLLSQCGQFTIRHMPDMPLRLRIGLHTGPCVTGVVGLRMPRYCLFGDTVNTASRMESTGARK
ncbi:Retinal guanylyl cyclase 2 [Lamellibrachia satsuma]|nr:Retinal guanylyl cyclase 2 [Lamellibrachia satsuma]